MTRERLITAVLWAAVLAVAGWFRLWQLGTQVLIDDEWHAVHRLMWVQSYREIFLSFGHADYSVPLTLLFRWMAETIGLTEWRMRLLPLLSGLVTVVLVPWMLRPWIKREAALLLGALLAVSPVLIHFSRYVRPYAIVLPLAFAAVMALWHWWHRRDRRWLVVYVPGAVLAGWLHPLTLLFTGAAMLYFVFQAAWAALARGNWEGFRRVVPVGLLTLLPVLALILPPLLADPAAMQSKSGVHQVKPETLVWAWHLVLGTAYGPAMLVLSGLALVGGWGLWRRERAFCMYWLFMMAIAMMVVVLLQPAWIHHALVLLRYLLVALPMALALIALGMVSVADGLKQRTLKSVGRFVIPISVMAVVLLYGLTGPLAYTYRGINQFTNHARYYFDFDFERSVYDRLMRQLPLPEAYARMDQEPGPWEVVYGPWWFESHFNRIAEYQRRLQFPVRIGMVSGLCTDWTYGETRAGMDLKIDFQQFVPLQALTGAAPGVSRFVVLHRPAAVEGRRALPDVAECMRALREELGEPWLDDGVRVVYRLPAGA